ncbi:MAG: mechanosensitive ion channel family protein [Acidimicrobiia bacterium]
MPSVPGTGSVVAALGPIPVKVERFLRDQGLRLVLVALGTAITVRLVRIGLARARGRFERLRMGERADPRRVQAFFDILSYLGVGITAGIGLLGGLSVLGVNTGALLASAGVVGFAVGFGAQTIVKDLLNGLFLLAEDQYTIGDVIAVGGVSGVVERVTLRTTTLRADNGDLHIVPSGDVRVLTNKSRGWAGVRLDLSFPPGTPIGQVANAGRRLCDELVDDAELSGHLLGSPEVQSLGKELPSGRALISIVCRVPAATRVESERRLRTRLPVPLGRPSTGESPFRGIEIEAAAAGGTATGSPPIGR